MAEYLNANKNWTVYLHKILQAVPLSSFENGKNKSQTSAMFMHLEVS